MEKKKTYILSWLYFIYELLVFFFKGFLSSESLNFESCMLLSNQDPIAVCFTPTMFKWLALQHWQLISTFEPWNHQQSLLKSIQNILPIHFQKWKRNCTAILFIFLFNFFQLKSLNDFKVVIFSLRPCFWPCYFLLFCIY